MIMKIKTNFNKDYNRRKHKITTIDENVIFENSYTKLKSIILQILRHHYMFQFF